MSGILNNQICEYEKNRKYENFLSIFKRQNLEILEVDLFCSLESVTSFLNNIYQIFFREGNNNEKEEVLEDYFINFEEDKNDNITFLSNKINYFIKEYRILNGYVKKQEKFKRRTKEKMIFFKYFFKYFLDEVISEEILTDDRKFRFNMFSLEEKEDSFKYNRFILENSIFFDFYNYLNNPNDDNKTQISKLLNIIDFTLNSLEDLFVKFVYDENKKISDLNNEELNDKSEKVLESLFECYQYYYNLIVTNENNNEDYSYLDLLYLSEDISIEVEILEILNYIYTKKDFVIKENLFNNTNNYKDFLNMILKIKEFYYTKTIIERITNDRNKLCFHNTNKKYVTSLIEKEILKTLFVLIQQDYSSKDFIFNKNNTEQERKLIINNIQYFTTILFHNIEKQTLENEIENIKFEELKEKFSKLNLKEIKDISLYLIDSLNFINKIEENYTFESYIGKLINLINEKEIKGE